MRKRNNVKQLNRNHAHRKAMLRNMVTSLFEQERITSTKARVKALQPLAERMITRAKKTVGDDVSAETKLHHKRELLKTLRSRSTLVKLCEDIAVRNSERSGGYTRVMLTVNRSSDNSEMAILELVEKKEAILIQEERRARKLLELPKKKREKKEAELKAAGEAAKASKGKKDKKKDKKEKKKKKDKGDE